MKPFSYITKNFACFYNFSLVWGAPSILDFIVFKGVLKNSIDYQWKSDFELWWDVLFGGKIWE